MSPGRALVREAGEETADLEELSWFPLGDTELLTASPVLWFTFLRRVRPCTGDRLLIGAVGSPWVPDPVNDCLWGHPGEDGDISCLKNQPPPRDSAHCFSRRRLKERNTSSGSLGGWRAEKSAELEACRRRHSEVSLHVPPCHPRLPVQGWSHCPSPSALLCLSSPPGCPFPSHLASILLSVRWAGVCKAGWENPYNAMRCRPHPTCSTKRAG